MNERIQELMKQSMVEHQFDYRFSPEKFAELIVKECVCLVLNGKYDEEKFRADDEFHQGHNCALDGTAEGIKLHFGVEE